MVPEAPLEPTDHGLLPRGDGWFVLNAREAPWADRKGRGYLCRLEGETRFPQVGINLQVLRPGEPMARYHWERDQEGFLVLAGRALLIIEGQERELRAWDFVHCPAETKHVIVGAGTEPCVVLAVGGRDHVGTSDWGGYSVDAAAIRHGAGVDEETSDASVAYVRYPEREPTRYVKGWLPGENEASDGVMARLPPEPGLGEVLGGEVLEIVARSVDASGSPGRLRRVAAVPRWKRENPTTVGLSR